MLMAMDRSVMDFSHTGSSSPLLPGRQVSRPEDVGFWEDYFKKVADEDIHLITRWQKILDTLLVYVGLFIGVLTAFIIQVSNVFQPSPADATNKILIAIYNHTMNASTPIDLQQYNTWDEGFDWTLSTSVYLLYISLAVSIIEAAFALFISIWLNRYQCSLTMTGPTIHERIRRRQEAYRGLMEWRLPILIEILPIVALVALILFSLFISLSIGKAYPAVMEAVSNIFIGASVLFVFTASFAAFIPGAPFHSPLSGAIRFIFQIFPNRSIGGFVRVRTVCVTFIFISGSVVQLFNFRQIWLLRIVDYLLPFFIPVSLLSLCQGSRKEKETQEQPKPRLFSLATWLYSHSIVNVALSYTIPYTTSVTLFVLACLRGIDLFVVTVGAMKMSRWPPDEGRAKVEAVAWMIKTQPSHNLLTYQNAVEIARNSGHLRSTLLKDILPVLDLAITSIRGDREEDLADEEKICITLLAVLVDFETCEASFWRNEAAVKRPVLSDGLKERLGILRTGCAGSCSPLSGCTSVEAKFILGKVGCMQEKEDSSLQACC